MLSACRRKVAPSQPFFGGGKLLLGQVKEERLGYCCQNDRNHGMFNIIASM